MLSQKPPNCSCSFLCPGPPSSNLSTLPKTQIWLLLFSGDPLLLGEKKKKKSWTQSTGLVRSGVSHPSSPADALATPSIQPVSSLGLMQATPSTYHMALPHDNLLGRFLPPSIPIASLAPSHAHISTGLAHNFKNLPYPP